MIVHARQARQNVAQLSVGIQASASAAFDERIEDGSPVSGFGLAYEEPVLLPQGGGADGVFDQVIVDLHPAVGQVHLQCFPLAQGLVQGQAQ